jgi:hypothetical protein
LGIAYIASDRENKPLYRVQVGAYTVKANAQEMQKKLKAKGFESFITILDILEVDDKEASKTSSTKVLHFPQSGHFPKYFGVSYPQF